MDFCQGLILASLGYFSFFVELTYSDEVLFAFTGDQVGNYSVKQSNGDQTEVYPPTFSDGDYSDYTIPKEGMNNVTTESATVQDTGEPSGNSKEPLTEENFPDVGERLFLSELIEDGKIEEARARAEVSGGPFPQHIPGYSGFLTVNKRFNSNLFFWFFPAESNYENAPVLLWLQGGPGDSSLIGLFDEMGPFTIEDDDISLRENPHSWHKNHSLIFIDNPVGAGFSFTDHDEGYATNLKQVSEALYESLIQFFTLFPEVQKNDFYIAGESFAGKYVPALAHTIHTTNVKTDFKINLKGIAVGNGYTDPATMLSLSEVVYNLGLVDFEIKEEMALLEKEGQRAFLDEDYEQALDKLVKKEYLLKKHSHYQYYYNVLHATVPYDDERYTRFVNNTQIRKLLHVGDAKFSFLSGSSSGGKVLEKLRAELMTSAKPWLQALLDHYKVLYYSGQLDIVVPYPLSVNMYRTLRWKAEEEYRTGTRHPWFNDGELAGYMKSGGNFTEVLVRHAGHMVPLDQPVWALDLITRFTYDKLPHQEKSSASCN